MVYYYRSTGSDNSYESNPRFVYMGKDQNENDDLIKFGFDEDVWFHVDKYSSAHVYLRLNPGERWDEIPEALLNDCSQLAKSNSIQGNKINNVTVIYTPWSNLRKSKEMKPGEVGFKNPKKVRRSHVQMKDSDILHRLKLTRQELCSRNLLISARNARDKDMVPRMLQQAREEKEESAAEKKKAVKEAKKAARELKKAARELKKKSEKEESVSVSVSETESDVSDDLDKLIIDEKEEVPT